MRTSFPLFVVAAFLVGCVGEAAAQPLGTFRWQQPYCNILTLLPTANGPVFRLEGFDNQCGGARAAVIGMAVVNANGTIGFGLTVVTAPGAAPLHVDVSLDLSTLAAPGRMTPVTAACSSSIHQYDRAADPTDSGANS